MIGREKKPDEGEGTAQHYSTRASAQDNGIENYLQERRDFPIKINCSHGQHKTFLVSF